MNTSRLLLFTLLATLVVPETSQANSGTHVSAVAVILDDSSSMSKEHISKPGNDPKGYAAFMAAARVFSLQPGTQLAYFTFGSQRVQGSTPLFEITVGEKSAQLAQFETIRSALTQQNVTLARKPEAKVNWSRDETPHPYWMNRTTCMSTLLAATSWLKGTPGDADEKKVFMLADGSACRSHRTLR